MIATGSPGTCTLLRSSKGFPIGPCYGPLLDSDSGGVSSMDPCCVWGNEDAGSRLGPAVWTAGFYISLSIVWIHGLPSGPSADFSDMSTLFT